MHLKDPDPTPDPLLTPLPCLRPLRSGTPLWEDGLCLLRTELRTDRYPQKRVCLRQLVCHHCHLQALFDLAELQQALWNLPAAVLWLQKKGT